jgi:chromosome segregation ATPase
MNIPETVEIREAVIKLETKMEQMSEAVTSMSDSVRKLADIRYDLREARKEAENNYDNCKERQALLMSKQEELKRDMDSQWIKLREIGESQARNTWVTDLISKASWLVIGGMVSFVYWMIQNYGV